MGWYHGVTIIGHVLNDPHIHTVSMHQLGRDLDIKFYRSYKMNGCLLSELADSQQGKKASSQLAR